MDDIAFHSSKTPEDELKYWLLLYNFEAAEQVVRKYGWQQHPEVLDRILQEVLAEDSYADSVSFGWRVPPWWWPIRFRSGVPDHLTGSDHIEQFRRRFETWFACARRHSTQRLRAYRRRPAPSGCARTA